MNAHIVVIEDTDLVLRLCVKILENAGYEVTTASNGIDGLGLITSLYEEHHPPDIILTDVNMPILDGIGMVERLMKLNNEGELISDPFLKSRVIFMSGDLEGHRPEELERLSANRYLEKPFQAAGLCGAIATALMKLRCQTKPGLAGTT